LWINLQSSETRVPLLPLSLTVSFPAGSFNGTGAEAAAHEELVLPWCILDQQHQVHPFVLYESQSPLSLIRDFFISYFVPVACSPKDLRRSDMEEVEVSLPMVNLPINTKHHGPLQPPPPWS
jgi:hypothetical protein